ncbi:MAG: hypothetical protein HDQ87_09430 [Clostridia bacterium]|nr:hypothetical protein [Clostridia bacterium]
MGVLLGELMAAQRGRPKKCRYRKLRELKAAMSVSGEDIGKALRLSGSAISRKLCGNVAWHVDECYMVLDFLGVDRDMIYYYFPLYGEDVEKTVQQTVKSYLAATDQMLVPCTLIDMLVTIVNGMAKGGFGAA